jgi:hypothetical protein
MNRVTAKRISEIIEHVEYMTSGYSGVIVCVITLNNGYGVVGNSGFLQEAHINKASFFTKLKKKIQFRYRNRKHGRQLAYENAISKIWELEAYRICCDL